MNSAVSRSSRLGKKRKRADETLPSSTATARRDSPWELCAASWRRAASLISRVSSALARSRAVRVAVPGAVIRPVCQFREHRSITRTLLLTVRIALSILLYIESSAHIKPGEHPMSVRPESAGSPERRYVVPASPAGCVVLSLFNSTVAASTRLGISILGSRVLYVRGPTSCAGRSTPGDLLPFDG